MVHFHFEYIWCDDKKWFSLNRQIGGVVAAVVLFAFQTINIWIARALVRSWFLYHSSFSIREPLAITKNLFYAIKNSTQSLQLEWNYLGNWVFNVFSLLISFHCSFDWTLDIEEIHIIITLLLIIVNLFGNLKTKKKTNKSIFWQIKKIGFKFKIT